MKNKWFTIIKIRPQLYAIAEFQHFQEVISYFVVGKTKTILIDTGLGRKSIHKVIKTVTDLPTTVLLTHKHWDHIGGILKSDIVIDVSKRKKIKLDGFMINIIHTPGHTPDSVCFYFSFQNWLFLGDTFYPGPLYAHLPESNIHKYAASLNKLLKKITAQTLLLPGHNKTPGNYSMFRASVKLMQQVDNTKPSNRGNTVHGEGFSILIR